MDQIKKLSDTEIEEIIRKMDRMFLEEGYEQAAVMLDARRITDSTMTCRNDLISCMMKSPILRMP